jgi:hypothetical protein
MRTIATEAPVGVAEQFPVLRRYPELVYLDSSGPPSLTIRP